MKWENIDQIEIFFQQNQFNLIRIQSDQVQTYNYQSTTKNNSSYRRYNKYHQEKKKKKKESSEG